MEHGADLLTYKDKFEGELIDFSSNINPLGPPEGLDEVLINSFKFLVAYPDIQYRHLRESIAKYLGACKENILVGNGAVEIIDDFIMKSGSVTVMLPGFSEYEKRAIAHKKEVYRLYYNDDLTINMDEFNNLEEGTLLVLGNPNNPSGLRIPKNELVKIYKLVKKAKAYLLLDEAFFEFCPDDYNSVELFKEFDYESVGIIRAATKFFALPGIRLGYGCASKKKVIELQKSQLPWSVNALADAAGQHIFNDKKYIEDSKLYIEGERNFLLTELPKIKRIKVYPTKTNFILIKLLNCNEKYVFNFFLSRGILIRKCSSFKELEGDHIRVAIKSRENNMKLLYIFKELSKGEN
ncbi:MAG: aminotransferase class I/II-fold pyridoxal phosphate-dependent enzyme [Tissierellia bacterium]|nr:aminotransferase class I/II-fold pyridoxal phosphate-dependent enzyme [Tissierellia bacterium]